MSMRYKVASDANKTIFVGANFDHRLCYTYSLRKQFIFILSCR